MDTQNNQSSINPEVESSSEQRIPTDQRPVAQPFMKNHYMVLVISAAVLLIIVILSIMFMNAKNPNNANPASNPPTSSGQAVSPSVPASVSPAISQTPTDSPQITEIKTQINQQITKLVAPGLNFTITSVKVYGGSWATADINSSSAGGSTVIAEKKNGAWTVVLGPGSFFPQQDLNNLNAPQALVNSIESTQTGGNASPSPAISGE
jgi:hypothetical protein